MGYAHIENLYKNQLIFMFKECFAMEKVHGTSAHLIWKDQKLGYFSGGASHEAFKSLFNEAALSLKLAELFPTETVHIHGEAYGGKEQAMKLTYGDKLQFIVFDVQVNDWWLSVENAFDVTTKLELEFIPFRKIPATLEALDAERDLPSEVAVRRGCGNNTDKFGFNPPIREGIVCRPIYRFMERIACKHKRDEFAERVSVPKVVDAAKLQVLEDATAIADEWVVSERLNHVLDKLDNTRDMSRIPEVIRAMIEDVYREGKGEIIESKEVCGAISKRTVYLFKELVKNSIKQD